MSHWSRIKCNVCNSKLTFISCIISTGGKQIIDKKAKEATAKLTKQDEEAKQLYSIIARSAFTYTACA